MTDQEFHHLLEQLMENEVSDAVRELDPEQLTPEQSRELLEHLTLEPRLREAFNQPGSFTAGVMKRYESESPASRTDFREAVMQKAQSTGHMTQAKASPSIFLPKILPWGIAALFAILFALSYSTTPKKQPAPTTQSDRVHLPEEVPPTAILVAEADADFSPNHRPQGVRFLPGFYDLRSGAIHLRFLNGVDLAIRGPARFKIHDSLNVDLEQGAARALVPESGHLFTINTPAMRVIDLGTEFGVVANGDDQSSEVRVFDGKVHVVPAGTNQTRELNTNETLRYSEKQGIEPSRLTASSFPAIDSIGFQQWQKWATAISHDPDLIAYLPFQKQFDRLKVFSSLPNPPSVSMNGVEWKTGRWPGKDALLFEKDGDHVELDLGADYQEFTLSLWIKCHRTDYPISSLANSSGWAPGSLHLQISRTNRVIWGGVRTAKSNADARAYAPSPFSLNNWVQVTYVFSKSQGKSLVYFNGTPGPAGPIPSDTVINPRNLRLGDWKILPDQSADNPQRGFRGLIDECLIFKRALTQQEIDTLITQGRPSFLWPN